MMQYRPELRFASRLARKTLNKYRRGTCEKKAEAALAILRNRELFNRFVQVRMDRRKENAKAKREKGLTFWQRFVNFIRHKK